MEKVLILSAPLLSKIWGSSYYKDVLKITDIDNIGEMWSVSGYKGCESTILNGKFKGLSLDKVFKENKELFNNQSLESFPILVKILAPSDKLSIQVHPDDKYAIKENQRGKTEGWLILDAKNDASIILGHDLNSKEEVVEAINNGNIENVLVKRKVTKGEFYPINPGTIHGLDKDIVIAEIQQSSDLTYRIYDYNRKDDKGNLRELHVEKAKEVVSDNRYNEIIHNVYKENLKTIWDNQYFKVDLYNVDGKFNFEIDKNYQIVTVVDGYVNVDEFTLKLGDSFIITSNSKVKVNGKGKIIVTTSKE